MSPITISTTARIALAGFAALAISLTGAAGMASAKPICETGCSQPLPTKNPGPTSSRCAGSNGGRHSVR